MNINPRLFFDVDHLPLFTPKRSTTTFHPNYDNRDSVVLCSVKVTPTAFWLKCKNLPKCSKFCSTRKLEVAAKNFGLLTKNGLIHWQIRWLKGSISGNLCAVCLNL